MGTRSKNYITQLIYGLTKTPFPQCKLMFLIFPLFQTMIKIALLQVKIAAIKSSNIKKVRSMISEAVINNAKIVVLPECFNCPYGINYFKEYSEPERGDTWSFLQQQSFEHSILLIGGSIPEIDINNKIYNTCFVFENGEYLGKHRKVHLFDIDIPNKIKFTESQVLSSGKQVTTLKTSFGLVGIGICYDIRFPEMQMISARRGAFLLCYPGAFNQVTGPLHWDLLMRSRAMDNQVFVAACAPALDTNADYHSYGHSLIVDPMGKILQQAKEKEEIIYAELNLDEIESTRSGIPTSKQRRFDVYPRVD
eukprot:NODE_284_length_11815_cov_0.176340.p2 type:complete len:308 gc:universal NODE_284_length_11815_cov_0.176340:3365-4288(+)